MQINLISKLKSAFDQSLGTRRARQKGMTKAMTRHMLSNAHNGVKRQLYLAVDRDGDIASTAYGLSHEEAIKWFTQMVRSGSYAPYKLVTFDIIAETKQVNEFKLEVHDDSIEYGEDAGRSGEASGVDNQARVHAQANTPPDRHRL